MDILLYNEQGELVSAYTPNSLNYEKDDEVSILNENYKVVDIEKYRKLNINIDTEFVAMELERLKINEI